MRSTPPAIAIRIQSGVARFRPHVRVALKPRLDFQRGLAELLFAIFRAPGEVGILQLALPHLPEEGLECGLGLRVSDAGASRAKSFANRLRRSSKEFYPGVIWAFIIIGTKTCDASAMSTPSKPGAATPTMVKA
jgi:hypothetical protein